MVLSFASSSLFMRSWEAGLLQGVELCLLIMQRIEFQKNGIRLNTIERLHIHTEAAANNHFNDDHTISTNRIFDTILKDIQEENQ